MGRYYRLSKEVKPDQLKKITDELGELQDVELAEGDAEKRRIRVETHDDKFAEVMGAAVNIFSREANGTEIMFDGFAYK